MMQSMNLSIKSVNKQFRQGNTMIQVLENVSATFKAGESYAIMGVSGTGKSTLMHILAGLDVPSAGRVWFDGRDVNQFSEGERQQFLSRSVGLMFQFPYLIKELSVKENIMAPGIIAGHGEISCAMRGEELLRAVGLHEKSDSQVAGRSGGQQQRVALARALFNAPQFLLADEPTGNLDIETGMKMVELLLFLQKKYHMGIIISTHDQYVAERMQSVFVLRNGIL